MTERQAQWLIAVLIVYAAARKARQCGDNDRNLFQQSFADSLPAWRSEHDRPQVVAIIKHYRVKKPDKLALFRRILTVTNMMFLAGNRPGEPTQDSPSARKLKARVHDRKTNGQKTL